MKKHIYMVFRCFILLACFNLNAQDKYAAPEDQVDPVTMDGSINNPWDLQTGLDNIQAGETLNLRGGIYNGRFIVDGHAGESNSIITVMSYPGEWAILNGNLGYQANSQPSLQQAVLFVERDFYRFMDFEITAGIQFEDEIIERDCSGDVENFYAINGIGHHDGVCEFINLVIHDVTYLPFGSWKYTGGTKIYGCLVYNNGCQRGNEGADNAFYVQNNSTDYRVIENNILFNNFYKGIAVWSQGRITPGEPNPENKTQNVNIINNTSFNHATPATGGTKDNIFIGSNNQPPKNINIDHNQLYHNTMPDDYGSGGGSLVIGRGLNSNDKHSENIKIRNNLIVGKSALIFNNPKTIEFSNNSVFSRFVYVNVKLYHRFGWCTLEF